MATIWASFNEAFMLLSATCISIGWFYIRRKNIARHRLFMLLGSALGALFFVSYALDSVFVGDTEYGGPAKLTPYYDVFLNVHVWLASIAAVLGIITIRRALKQRFAKHRKIAPWTAVLWFVTTATGLVVFLMLFVIFPQGPILKNVIHVLLQ